MKTIRQGNLKITQTELFQILAASSCHGSLVDVKTNKELSEVQINGNRNPEVNINTNVVNIVNGGIFMTLEFIL